MYRSMLSRPRPTPAPSSSSSHPHTNHAATPTPHPLASPRTSTASVSSALAPQNVVSYVSDGTPDVLTIHVVDEMRGVTQDVRVSKARVLAEMHYFATYLHPSTSQTLGCDDDDVDIRVHCDSAVFAWLMAHIHHTPSTSPSSSSSSSSASRSAPKLTPDTALSILISADFLQMPALVPQTLAYMASVLPEMLRLPLDWDCLSPDLLRALAAHISLGLLDSLSSSSSTSSSSSSSSSGKAHPRTTFLSRLWECKVSEYIHPETNSGVQLSQCLVCKQLYATAHRDALRCPRAKVFVDFYGNVVAPHLPAPGFDLSTHIKTRWRPRLPWRAIYYRLWGTANVLECARCARAFPAPELEHCLWHPRAPVFPAPHANQGEYPCCGAPAVRFDATGGAHAALGCAARRHAVPQSAVVETIEAHRELILVPWKKPVAPQSATPRGQGQGHGQERRGGLGREKEVKESESEDGVEIAEDEGSSSDVDGERCSTDGPYHDHDHDDEDDDDDSNEDEDEDSSNEDVESNASEEAEEEYSNEDEPQKQVKEPQSSKTSGVRPKSHHTHQHHHHHGGLPAHEANAYHGKERIVALDNLRDDDDARMLGLCRRLLAVRTTPAASTTVAAMTRKSSSSALLVHATGRS